LHPGTVRNLLPTGIPRNPKTKGPPVPGHLLNPTPSLGPEKHMRKNVASREIRELSLLFEIARSLSEGLDLKTVLKPILRMIAEHMGILRGTLTILNRKKGEIVIEEAYGLRPEEQAKGKYRMGEGITGKVIDTGQPAIVPKISEEPL